MLSFLDAPTAPYDYRRWLDIEHAVAGLGYTADGVHYTRQYFASYPDGVIVMRIAADQPGKSVSRRHLRFPNIAALRSACATDGSRSRAR